MWAELQRALARFPDAVLTGLDADGRPAGARCRPRADASAEVLRCAAPPGLHLVDGPASLLCHGHDAELWSLRSFVARGALVVDGAEWVFTPTALTMGNGMGGPVSDLRVFVAARQRAGRYLARRGIARPAIQWARLRP